MDFDIRGEFAQYARLNLAQGQNCWAGTGAIMSYGNGASWRLRMPGGAAGAARRMLSGEGLALAYVEASRDGGSVTLAGDHPGRIFAWDLADGPVLTTRGSFLAAWGDIDISVTIARKAGAALFGGAGLFLQRVSGSGTVLVHASGDLDDRHLGAGDAVCVSTGHLAAFSAAVDYDISYVGGVRKAIFGGEGLFMTELRGPGRVLLQTLKRSSHTRRGS